VVAGEEPEVEEERVRLGRSAAGPGPGESRRPGRAGRLRSTSSPTTPRSSRRLLPGHRRESRPARRADRDRTPRSSRAPGARRRRDTSDPVRARDPIEVNSRGRSRRRTGRRCRAPSGAASVCAPRRPRSPQPCFEAGCGGGDDQRRVFSRIAMISRHRTTRGRRSPCRSGASVVSVRSLLEHAAGETVGPDGGRTQRGSGARRVSERRPNTVENSELVVERKRRSRPAARSRSG
jgi:hypothetical protein